MPPKVPHSLNDVFTSTIQGKGHFSVSPFLKGGSRAIANKILSSVSEEIYSITLLRFATGISLPNIDILLQAKI